MSRYSRLTEDDSKKVNVLMTKLPPGSRAFSAQNTSQRCRSETIPSCSAG